MSGASDYTLAEKQRQRYKGRREPVPWSETLWEDILAMVRIGASVHFAASSHGVSASRLRGWLEDNEAMREEFGLAEEEGHTRMFVELRQASRGDIKGLQWLLQRRYPEVWKEKQTIEFEGTDNSAQAAMDKLEHIIASTKAELTDGVEQSTMAGDTAPTD